MVLFVRILCRAFSVDSVDDRRNKLTEKLVLSPANSAGSLTPIRSPAPNVFIASDFHPASGVAKEVLWKQVCAGARLCSLKADVSTYERYDHATLPTFVVSHQLRAGCHAMPSTTNPIVAAGMERIAGHGKVCNNCH